MSDRSTIDSPALLPLDAPGQTAPSRADAMAASGNGRAAPKRVRRRPTFDDNALTRVFKFPSKTYPRSSYYVTSTEIIIRIKKARKKWKLIVPKKRVKSYRTNRWFAKPRWVELELTYTQALKLGLVEARVAVPEPVATIEANHAAAPEPQDDGAEASEAFAFIVEDTVDAGEASQHHTDPADLTGQFHDNDSATDFQLSADLDEPDLETFDSGSSELMRAPKSAEVSEAIADTPPPGVQSAPAGPLTGLQHLEVGGALEPCTSRRVPLADDAVAPESPAETMAVGGTIEPEPIVGAQVISLPARQQQSSRRRGIGRRVFATLAASITAFAVLAAIDRSSPTPDFGCASVGGACHKEIVTGSLGQRALPHVPAVPALEDPGMAAAPQIVPVARGEVAAKDGAALSKMESMAPAPEDVHSPDVGGVVSEPDVVPPPSLLTVTASLAPAALDTPPADCDRLEALGRAVEINFDYGYANLDPVSRVALDAFAAKLSACPARKVVVEGHTDSDGRPQHNRSLSLRRAQAVQKHLVEAGVDQAQLAAIGLGATRPKVPNVSAKNKRFNRRAILVVAP